MSILDHPIGVRFIVGTIGAIHVTIVIYWAGYTTEKDVHEKPNVERVDCSMQSVPTLDLQDGRTITRSSDETYTRTVSERHVPPATTVREVTGSVPSDRYLQEPPEFISYPVKAD